MADNPNRPRFEVELTLRVWKTDNNGRRIDSQPMSEFPARWTDCDESAVVAIESAAHQMQGRLIQLGAAKAVSTSGGIDHPQKLAYLQHVIESGPATPLDMPPPPQ